ncbi:amidohydrolase family protein [Formosa sp. S-31]|uniref:amidohydrolase family protein n=1 Tax=Formosa sp. S-31 TaxID=2790949 RepID=UPI003EB7640D
MISLHFIRFYFVVSFCLSLSVYGQEPTLIIENGRVIIGDGLVLEQATVALDGERILSVTQEPIISSTVKRIDATGKTVMPGLIDAHVHLTVPMAKDLETFNVFLSDTLPYVLKEFLRHGITTVRSTGDAWPYIGEVRDQINAGKLEGPRILTSGPVLTYKEGHPANTVCKGNPLCRKLVTRELGTPEEAKIVVQQLAKEGVDFIKFVSDSILYPVSLPNDIEEAIIQQAHKEYKQAVAHIAEVSFIERAVENGLDGLVHAPNMPFSVETAKNMGKILAKHHVPYTTTITPYIVFYLPSKEAFRTEGVKKRKEAGSRFNEMNAMGAQMLVGTDWTSWTADKGPNFGPGAMLLTEMIHLVKGGIPVLEVIKATTLSSAQILGLDKKTGSLEPGKQADILIVDGNPLEDINALKKTVYVLKGGGTVFSK